MKLKDVVQALVMKQDISDKDIEQAVLFLMHPNVLRDYGIFSRIVNKMNEEMTEERKQQLRYHELIKPKEGRFLDLDFLFKTIK